MIKRSDGIMRYINCCLVIIMAMAMTGCSGNKVLVKAYPADHIIPMDRLTPLNDTKRLKDCIFYVDKGGTIPLAISMESDFMAIKQEQVDLVAKRRLYFRIHMPEHLSESELAELEKFDAQTLSRWSDEKRRAFLKKYMLYVSMDAVHWAPLSSIHALREVLGYRRGTVSFTMAAGSERGVGASLIVLTVR